jgi:hypothetical protein
MTWVILNGVGIALINPARIGAISQLLVVEVAPNGRRGVEDGFLEEQDDHALGPGRCFGRLKCQVDVS